MTVLDIDSMKAGHELNALVAEKVMGIKVRWEITSWVEKNKIKSCEMPYEDNDDSEPILEYSSNIADVWLVVEKLKVLFDNYFEIVWMGDFAWNVRNHTDEGLCCKKEITAGHTQSAPLAICKAALKAVMT